MYLYKHLYKKGQFATALLLYLNPFDPLGKPMQTRRRAAEDLDTVGHQALQMLWSYRMNGSGKEEVPPDLMATVTM